jgi:hypothetical protein
MLHERGPAVTECPECKNLLDQNSRAIENHLHIIGQLQEAALRGDIEGSTRLEAALKRARKERNLAIEKYQEHVVSHQVRSASGSASMY